MYYRTVSYTYNISIITHNRPALLEKTISSVLQSVKKRDVLIHVIWQNPKDSTTEITQRVLDKFSSNLASIILQEKRHFLPEDNIDMARLEALTNAFRDPLIEHAIILEDDVCIAKDSMDFVESVIRNESKKFNFRGINFGSREVVNSPFGYSRIRYGIHGPASAISRKTWKKSGLATAGPKSLPRTWDGYIEPYLKTGFMVTPNLSRYIDYGTHGTHANVGNKDYFEGLENSFGLLGSHQEKISVYFHEQIEHTWRFDSRRFRLIMNPYYLLRFNLSKMRDYLEQK